MTGRGRLILPAALLAALPLGGCTAGALTMDILATREAGSIHYRLDPDGRLAITPAIGTTAGEHAGTLHQTRLTDRAIADLKRVIADSRFLLQDAPARSGLPFGTALRVEIEMGLWRNVVQLYGERMDSVSRILAEMNRHLPKEYRLVYDPPSPAEQQRRLEDYFK